VNQDCGEAQSWFTTSAEKGSVLGQSWLGYAGFCGKGLARDCTAAARWHSKAAEQGDADAQYELVLAYENGKGIALDYIQAYKWYSRAASIYSGLDEVSEKYAAIAVRESVARLMTPNLVLEAKKLAKERVPGKG